MGDDDAGRSIRTRHGVVGKFNPDRELFENYARRMTIYFKANKVEENDQTLYFLSLVGADMFGLIIDLMSPKEPETCKFADIIAKLQNITNRVQIPSMIGIYFMSVFRQILKV